MKVLGNGGGGREKPEILCSRLFLTNQQQKGKKNSQSEALGKGKPLSRVDPLPVLIKKR